MCKELPEQRREEVAAGKAMGSQQLTFELAKWNTRKQGRIFYLEEQRNSSYKDTEEQ